MQLFFSRSRFAQPVEDDVGAAAATDEANVVGLSFDDGAEAFFVFVQLAATTKAIS